LTRRLQNRNAVHRDIQQGGRSPVYTLKKEGLKTAESWFCKKGEAGRRMSPAGGATVIVFLSKTWEGKRRFSANRGGEKIQTGEKPLHGRTKRRGTKRRGRKHDNLQKRDLRSIAALSPQKGRDKAMILDIWRHQ